MVSFVIPTSVELLDANMYFLKIQLGKAATMYMAPIKLEVVNIMTTYILRTLDARQSLLAHSAHFQIFFSMVYLPYNSIRDNALCISLIIIYSLSQTNRSICRNFSGIVVLVQVYGPDHLVVFCCMVLWIIVTKVDFRWVPIYTEMFLWNPVLTPIEPHVRVFGAPIIDGIICDPYLCGVIGCYWCWFTLGPSHLFQLCSYNLRLFHVNK